MHSRPAAASPPATRREWLALGLILAVAALLRMGWPGLTEFKQDEAHLYALALDLAELRAFPLRGISSSVGLPNPPVSVYLFALPLFVWKSPLAATLFAGALNTASVAVGYWLARRCWGVRLALVASALYAAAPWAVLYSRKIWAQDLLPLFTVGALAAGIIGFVEGRRWWLAAHLALVFVAAQIHLSGLALVPLTVLLVVVHWRGLDKPALLAGLGLGALPALPIALYAFTNLGGLAGAARRLASQPAEVSPASIELAAMVVQGTHVRGLAGAHAFRAFEATVPDFTPLLWLLGALVVAGFGVAVGRWWAARGRARTLAESAGLIAALWLVVPALFFLPHATPVFPHYFITLFPAPFVLAALAVEAAARRWRQSWLWLVPMVIALSQVWLVAALLRFVGQSHTPGAFGTPLAYMLQAAETARALGSEVVVVADGADPAHDLAPAVFDVLLRGTPHRFVDGRTTAVFPPGDAAVLLWPPAQPYPWAVAAYYQAWSGGQWAARLPLRAGEGEAWLATAAGPQPTGFTPRAASALLANGVELLGAAGRSAAWELWWRPPGPETSEHYHVFVHLLSPDGALVAQADAPTYAPHDWRAGDLVASSFPLPAQAGTVRVGMYAYPSLAPVPVLDVAGNPAGDWLLLPRLTSD